MVCVIVALGHEGMIGMVHASYSTTGPSIGANERERNTRPLSEETISLRTRVLENSRLCSLGSLPRCQQIDVRKKRRQIGGAGNT